MMPDKGADTEDGAAGWASGSQECRGTRPALTPKPARQSARAVWNQSGQRRGGKDAQNEQAGQHEQRAARAHHIVFEASLIGRAASFVNHQEV